MSFSARNFLEAPLPRPLPDVLNAIIKEWDPGFDFVVKCGGKANPPRTMRRLIALLLHETKRKDLKDVVVSIEAERASDRAA